MYQVCYASIKYRFTCGDSDLSEIIKKCHSIMTRIVVQQIYTLHRSEWYVADDFRISSALSIIPGKPPCDPADS